MANPADFKNGPRHWANSSRSKHSPQDDMPVPNQRTRQQMQNVDQLVGQPDQNAGVSWAVVEVADCWDHHPPINNCTVGGGHLLHNKSFVELSEVYPPFAIHMIMEHLCMFSKVFCVC